MIKTFHFLTLLLLAALSTKLYAQCPSNESATTGDSVCFNASFVTVTIQNSTKGATYQAYYGASTIGTAVKSEGGPLMLSIPLGTKTGQLNTTEKYNTIKIIASAAGCEDVDLSNRATITVEPKPSVSLSVIGDEICSTNASATITIPFSSSGVLYQVYSKTELLDEVTGDGNTLWSSIPSSKLLTGNNMIVVKAVFGTCAKLMLQDSVNIRVNPSLEYYLEATGSTIISLKDSAEVTVKQTEPLAAYNLYFDNAELESRKISTNGILKFKFGVPATVESDFIVTVKMSSPVSCSPSLYADTALIKIQKVVAGIGSLTAGNDFNIWPNPVSSELNISSNILFNSIRLTDVMGILVFQSSFEPVQFYHLHSKLTKGVYHLTIEGPGFKKHSQIIKN